MKQWIYCLLALCVLQSHLMASVEMIELWPEAVPGESKPKAEPLLSDRREGNVTRLSEVTNPVLVVYEADPETRNGAALIICPGGGYGILAIDKEGYEVAEWYSKLGYTCFVLQYRVPRKQEGALQDAARAVRVIRSMPAKWDLDPDQIGMMGFSAGGSLAARLSSRYDEALYTAVDPHDSLSARPDFAILIYPAYLDRGEGHTLTPELIITETTPPTFLFVAADDPHANSSLVYASALRAEGIPFELHVLPEGRHGYGMRQGNRAAETWPGLCRQWLEASGQGQ